VIFPVAFSVHREDEPETFVLQIDDLLPRATYERIRVKLVLLDSDTGESRGFSAVVMFDQGAEIGHELMTLFRSQGGGLPNFASRGYLRALRGEIDKLLEEGSGGD
jgi:hypothetical protein